MNKDWRSYLFGSFLFLIIMALLGCLMWWGFNLLGYKNPKEAPALLRYIVLFVFIVVMVIVLNITTDGAYKRIQERRQRRSRIEN